MLTSTHLRHTMSILRSRAFFSTGSSILGAVGGGVSGSTATGLTPRATATPPQPSPGTGTTKPTSSLSSLYPAGAKVPASFPAFPPKAPLKPRKQPSKMQRPLGPLVRRLLLFYLLLLLLLLFKRVLLHPLIFSFCYPPILTPCPLTFHLPYPTPLLLYAPHSHTAPLVGNPPPGWQSLHEWQRAWVWQDLDHGGVGGLEEEPGHG